MTNSQAIHTDVEQFADEVRGAIRHLIADSTAMAVANLAGLDDSTLRKFAHGGGAKVDTLYALARACGKAWQFWTPAQQAALSLMVDRGLSQVQLAGLVGVGNGTISVWLRGCAPTCMTRRAPLFLAHPGVDVDRIQYPPTAGNGRATAAQPSHPQPATVAQPSGDRRPQLQLLTGGTHPEAPAPEPDWRAQAQRTLVEGFDGLAPTTRQALLARLDRLPAELQAQLLDRVLGV